MIGGFLILAVFIGLIYLLVWSLKRGKRKMAEQKSQQGKMTERQAAVEESLIITGLPPQNLPTAQAGLWPMLLLSVLLTPVALFILVGVVKSGYTVQQNHVKEARIQRGITLSPEAYAASEAYFDRQRTETSKAILPGILAWVILTVVIFVITK
jgi:hypothetical protein